MRPRRLALVATLAVSALLAGGLPARALDADPEWDFRLSAYIWALTMEGTVGVNGVEQEVDMSFADLFDQLNFGLFANLEARRDRLLFQVDFLGASLTEELSQTVPASFGPATIRQGPATLTVPKVGFDVGPIEVETDTTMFVVDLRAGWRLLSMPTVALFGGAADDGDTRLFDLDILAGTRFWYTRVEMDVTVPPAQIPGFNVGTSTPLPISTPDIKIPGNTVGGFSGDLDENVWWFDPVIGLRATIDATETISFSLTGDYGGFDIGSASQATWQAAAMGHWQFAENWLLHIGYRVLDIRRTGKSGPDQNLRLQSPVLGLGYLF